MPSEWHSLMFPGEEGYAIPEFHEWRGTFLGPYRHQNGIPEICVPLNTTAAVESSYRINDPDNFFPLSVQHLLECYPKDQKKLSRMAPIIYQQGMFKEHHYPNRLGLEKEACRMPQLQDKKRVFLDSFEAPTEVDPKDIIRHLLEGPVLAKTIMRIEYTNYVGERARKVLNEPPFDSRGRPRAGNHVLMLTGYRLDVEVPYFISLNSYGLTWGDEGRCKISMLNNALGVCDRIAIPRYDAEANHLRNVMMMLTDESYREDHVEEEYEV